MNRTWHSISEPFAHGWPIEHWDVLIGHILHQSKELDVLTPIIGYDEMEVRARQQVLLRTEPDDFIGIKPIAKGVTNRPFGEFDDTLHFYATYQVDQIPAEVLLKDWKEELTQELVMPSVCARRGSEILVNIHQYGMEILLTEHEFNVYSDLGVLFDQGTQSY